jgi:hypothetical protein
MTSTTKNWTTSETRTIHDLVTRTVETIAITWYYYVVDSITQSRATVTGVALPGRANYRCDHACSIGERVWHGAAAQGHAELL